MEVWNEKKNIESYSNLVKSIFCYKKLMNIWISADFSTSSCQRWIILSNGPIISSKHVLHRKKLVKSPHTHSKFKHKRLYTHGLLEQPRPPTVTTSHNGPKITIKSHYNFYPSLISRDISYKFSIIYWLIEKEISLNNNANSRRIWPHILQDIIPLIMMLVKYSDKLDLYLT